MKKLIAFSSAMLALSPQGAFAQSTALWQSLSAGDSPQAVAEKLAQLPEIKSAKVKGRPDAPRIAIAYKSTGLPILGEAYRVVPQFSEGKLHRVGLGALPSCVTDIDNRYDRLVAALKVKYPQFVVGPMERRDFLRAQLDATEAKPALVTTIMTNDTTAVVVVQQFTRKDPPPPSPYGATSSMLAAGRLLWSLYNQTAAECDGTGVNRVQMMVTYMPKDDLDREFDATRAEDEREISEASEQL